MEGRSYKRVVMAGILGALGNALSYLSIRVAPLVPSLPLGPLSVSIALDMSHIATFMAALFGGSTLGSLTGLIGGLIASYEFGFSKGNLITGFGLPLGKALTGLTAGLIFRRSSSSSNSELIMVPKTLASYIPEAAYTALLFIYIFPMVFGIPQWLASLLTLQILAKALIEMIGIGLILMSLTRNRGFFEYIKGIFS